MQAIGATILELLQNVSLLALVAAGYAALRRHGPQLRSTIMAPAIGILFALGAVMSIAFRITVLPGVFVDGRNIMTSLVAVFGGPVATLVTLVITAGYRLWVGGPGAISGIAGILAAGLVGLGFAKLRGRYRFHLRPPVLFGLGIAVVLVSAGTFALLHPAESPESLVALTVPLLLVTPIGTVLFGLALQSEDERRGLQEKLGEQAMLLEAIFQSIGNGIVVANEQARIVMTNPMARTLSATAARSENGTARVEDAKAFRIDGVTPMPADQMPMVQALRGEESNDVEIMIIGPDGDQRPVKVTGRPLVDARGRRRGGVIAFRDISNELILQESLRRSERRLRDAIDVMDNGFALFDADDRLIVCNSGFIDPGTRRTFGNPVGRTFEEIFTAFAHGELTAAGALADREAWLKWRLEVHRKPPREAIEVQWTDGRWMRVTERRTAEGGYVGIWTDITALKMAETRLREAIESIPEGFVLLDSDLKIKIFNRRMLDLYPVTAPAFAVGQSFHEVLRYGALHGEYPGVSGIDEVNRFVRQWTEYFRSEAPYFGEGAFADGRWVLVSHRRTASGDYVSIRTDITAQKQRESELAKLLQELTAAQAATEKANESLQRNSALLRSVTDAVPALVAYVDRQERYQYCNDEYRDILGVEPESMIGRPIAEIVEPAIYAVVKPQIERVLRGEEVEFVRPMFARGVTRYVEQRYLPSFGPAGSIDGFYAIAWDITESHNREQALSLEAQTDPLTGLLNRRGMTDALVEQVRRWRDGETQGAVLFLDIDRFKQINDTLGHDIGDELLKVFAERLRAVIRSSDKLARLGGDEFVILISAPETEEVAKRVATTLLDRVRQPVHLAGREISITTSIGIAIVRPGLMATHLEILKQADTALYEAKAAGRDRYALRQTSDIAG
jgi:diguanylate cyclase (GGDEF)-like protein/PAS domain S-box-containing protein